MDTTNYETSPKALARKLMAQHAAAQGYPGHASWVAWGLQLRWLEIPKASRPNFFEYVIGELNK